MNFLLKRKIKDLFMDGYTISELVIMYRDKLPDRETLAIVHIRRIVKGLERPERI